jgi:hypothetical protein
MELRCQKCNRKIEGRSDKKFCNGKCRVAFHRKPDARELIKSHHQDAQSAINGMLFHQGGPQHQMTQRLLKSLVIFAATYLDEAAQHEIGNQLRDLTKDYAYSLQTSVTFSDE